MEPITPETVEVVVQVAEETQAVKAVAVDQEIQVEPEEIQVQITA
jgi:hypothetical protein